jgi:hypothetical protein
MLLFIYILLRNIYTVTQTNTFASDGPGGGKDKPWSLLCGHSMCSTRCCKTCHPTMSCAKTIGIIMNLLSMSSSFVFVLLEGLTGRSGNSMYVHSMHLHRRLPLKP